MSYVLTGYKRSLSVTVTKTVNGITQAGYPKTYPTATDIANGYFTYNAVQYSIPPNGMTETAFARLTDVQYQSLLNSFKLYVMSLESGLNFNTQSLNSPEVYDATTCVPGTAADTTTTSTTSTTTETTTTTTVHPSIAVYNLIQSQYITDGDVINVETYDYLVFRVDNTGGSTMTISGVDVSDEVNWTLTTDPTGTISAGSFAIGRIDWDGASPTSCTLTINSDAVNNTTFEFTVHVAGTTTTTL